MPYKYIQSDNERLCVCVLCDDGSSDKSREICLQYSRKDSRFHVIFQENQGVSCARNTALDYAFKHLDFSYIGFVDSDDVIHPEMYEILLNLINKYGTSMAVCSYREMRCLNDIMEQKSADVHTEDEVLKAENALMGLFTAENDMFGMVMPKLYQKGLFERRRFMEHIIYEDVRSCYRVIDDAKIVAVTYQKLYYYRYSPDGITKSKYTKRRLDIVPAMDEQVEFFRLRGYSEVYKLAVKKYLYLLAYHYNLAHEKLGDPEIDAMLLDKARRLFKKERKYCEITPLNSPNCYNMLYPRLMRIYWIIYGVRRRIARDT